MNAGTNNRPATPAMKITFLSNAVVASPISAPTAGLDTSPLSLIEIIPRGTTIAIIEGTIRLTMIVEVVSCPPIQSIVVVTSPIGDHAPPALAEITTIPANNHLVSLSEISFLRSEIITIDVVRLSSTAEKKNVRMQIIHINFTLLFVLILSVITRNPSCASTNCTCDKRRSCFIYFNVMLKSNCNVS